MLAALLAAAMWERNQPAEAMALLANRLDVLGRSGLPESVLLGSRAVARGRLGMKKGPEWRLELLGALHAVGVARRLPRACSGQPDGSGAAACATLPSGDLP